MHDLISLRLVTKEEAPVLHKLQVESFWPLYEKCGFVRAGEDMIVNENMTLVDYVKNV